MIGRVVGKVVGIGRVLVESGSHKWWEVVVIVVGSGSYSGGKW